MRHATYGRAAALAAPVVLGALLLAPACGSGQKKQVQQNQAANRYRMGSSHLAEGRFRPAIHELAEAVRLEPKNALYQNLLGQAYFFVDQLDLAEEHLLKALKANGSLTEAHANLGLVYSEMGDLEKAARHYQAAVEDPAYFTPEKVYLNWGATLRKHEDPEGAEDKFRKALALNPQYARGYFEMGRLMEDRGDDDAALENYLKAYAGMGEMLELNLKLAEVYIRRGNPGQARRFLQKVLDSAPPNSSEALRAQAFLEQLSSRG